jgi:hypothetical protein
MLKIREVRTLFAHAVRPALAKGYRGLIKDRL